MIPPFEVNGHSLSVGISVGVSPYQAGWSAEQWLINADQAMYGDKGIVLEKQRTLG
ncbi:hypothetical protein D3C81_2301090 [compost metagenome]